MIWREGTPIPCYQSIRRDPEIAPTEEMSIYFYNSFYLSSLPNPNYTAPFMLEFKVRLIYTQTKTQNHK